MATLLDVPEGGRAVILEVAGAGWGLRRRLLEMGFTPGTEVEVVRNSGGHVVVRLRGSLLTVGRGVARRIVVEVVGGEGHQP